MNTVEIKGQIEKLIAIPSGITLVEVSFGETNRRLIMVGNGVIVKEQGDGRVELNGRVEPAINTNWKEILAGKHADYIADVDQPVHGKGRGRFPIY